MLVMFQNLEDSRAVVSFSVTGLPEEYRTITLESGLVCVGEGNNNNLKFSIPERVVAQVDNGTATFSNITVYEGTLLTQNWTVQMRVK